MLEITFLDYFWIFGLVILFLQILGPFFMVLCLLGGGELFVVETLIIMEVSTLVSKLVGSISY
jgi:hypothetical protein